jgi:nucleoside 2-deoxyribosyltransferase
MKKKVLDKTRTYLIGPMQYAEGRYWREDFSEFLNDINVTIFDPYKKPFINAPEEDEKTHEWMEDLMQKGDWRCEKGSGYDEVANHMKKVRNFDLSMVDAADFIICYLNAEVPTFGTMEELSWAARCKKPTFIIMEGGKVKTPFWVMGMFPHKYIYNSFDEVKEILTKIDEGSIKADSDRWRLFKHELR